MQQNSYTLSNNTNIHTHNQRDAFQGTDLTELDEHQHRGPKDTLQQCLCESVK